MSDTTPDYGEPWVESPSLDYLATADAKPILYNASEMNEPYRSRAIECVNATQGMADPAKEIADMREALKEASYALKDFRSFYIEMTKLPPCAANAALAKIQTILKP